MGNYKLKAAVVKAKLLTTDNIEEVARWCEGSVKGIKLPKHQQVVEFFTPDAEEIRAEIGDVIIKFLDGYCSKMSAERFHFLYEEVN